MNPSQNDLRWILNPNNADLGCIRIERLIPIHSYLKSQIKSDRFSTNLHQPRLKNFFALTQMIVDRPDRDFGINQIISEWISAKLQNTAPWSQCEQIFLVFWVCSYFGFVLVCLQSKRSPRENAEESYTAILPKFQCKTFTCVIISKKRILSKMTKFWNVNYYTGIIKTIYTNFQIYLFPCQLE